MRITKDILERWINEAPDIPKMGEREEFSLDLLQKELSEFNNFWRDVEEQLLQTIYISDCRNIILTAGNAADAGIRGTGKTPNDLPPYEFREWFIARSKVRHILDFMKRKKAELDNDMIYYLSKLEEQRRDVQSAIDRRG